MSDLTRRTFLTRSLQYVGAGISGMALQAGCGGGGGGPVAIGPTPPELTAMRNVATSFMTKYNIPGLSVAIARNDKLVYAYGFGLADKATGEAVTTNSLFRIASMSKPITAVTVIRLINANMLQLTDKVFGTGALLGNTYAPYSPTTSSWVQEITVEHLLTHTAGGWFEDNSQFPGFTDPVWQNLNLTLQQLIAQTMQTVPLQFAPGTYYGYSNFGYCLLGRVIEKVTGIQYAQAAQQQVLTPCGISGMQIGTSVRLPNEVVYYEPNESFGPYSVPIARLDAEGGWVATATDMVQFLMRVDGYPVVADIVPSQGSTITIQTMTTPPQGTTNSDSYGLGWFVDSSTQWRHDGSQPGARSDMERFADSFSNVYCWAILANTRDGSPSGVSQIGDSDFQATATGMINQVSAWQG